MYLNKWAVHKLRNANLEVFRPLPLSVTPLCPKPYVLAYHKGQPPPPLVCYVIYKWPQTSSQIKKQFFLIVNNYVGVKEAFKQFLLYV